MVQHRVALAVTEGAPVFELAIPCEVFGRLRAGLPEPWYDLRLCAPSGVPTPVSNGFAAAAPDGYDALTRAGTVVVTAVRDTQEEPAPELVAAIKAAHRGGARIVSLCTGAFVLAAAGLLDGRPATTHWNHADELARRYPAVRMDPGVLYVDDGDVLTSAGTTAGIDLCLHIVRTDHGAAVANTLARRLVAPALRDGGQAQYIEAPATGRDDPGLAPVLDWMREHLREPLTITVIARHASTTERTLIRHFRAITGATPIKWLNAQRIQRARELLETSSLPVEDVGEAVGLGAPPNFRRHFILATGVTPSTYRRAFNAHSRSGKGTLGAR
jgi:AraC family transcriptional regulator, transcriptional activator FtrA